MTGIKHNTKNLSNSETIILSMCMDKKKVEKLQEC